jgi:prepilin-type N-terminal cleavage/methylation domain-containing protein
MRSKPGFTLMEVMTIVAILGIVFLVAYPRFTGVKSLSRTTSRELVADLRNTRSMAISTGNAHYLELSPSDLPQYTTRYGIFDQSGIPIGETKYIPIEVTCTPPTGTFSFNYLGSCNNGTNGTITLLGEGVTCTVSIVGFTGTAFSP